MDSKAIVAAIVAGLKAVWPQLVNWLYALLGALAQKKYTEGNEAKDTLEALDRANRASRAVDNMSDADVMRELQRRGRMRDLP